MQPGMPRNGNHRHSGITAGPALSVLGPPQLPDVQAGRGPVTC